MRTALRVLIALVFVGFTLAACGNKGDLVLPPPEPAESDGAATR
jgi:predicted small lipoprotein YifL